MFLVCALCIYLVSCYLANHGLSFNLSIYQVAGLENLASADPHSRLWQPEGQYMAEPSYVCRYVPEHLGPENPHSQLWQPEGQYMAEPSYVCRYVPEHLGPENLHSWL